MDWDKFNSHGESKNHAFEEMCNILFEKWCKRQYSNDIKLFNFVNGAGGDGGVEAYCEITNGSIVAIQSKWFPNILTDSNIQQIYDSFSTATKIRPNIKTYIVCLPRDLTSNRIVKGGKVTQNSENDKWNKLIKRCKALKSDVEIRLWSSTTILSELQHPESAGSSKYWFENSEITFDIFDEALLKSKNSWALTKYIPDIYVTGHIHESINDLLNDKENIVKKQKVLSTALNNFGKLKEALIKVKQFISNDGLLADINEDIKTVCTITNYYKEANNIVNSGEYYCNKEEINFEFRCSNEKLKEERNRYDKYFHFHEVENYLEKAEQSLHECACLFRKEMSNELILLGNPGTGKTAGIVNEAVYYFNSKRHLPLIISAKRINNNKTWKDIITDYLGISNNWDEKELLNVLEIASKLRYRTISANESIVVKPKVLICIDGIDESKYKEFWISKIREARLFQSLYPSIKFVFLSRPYVFDGNEDRRDLCSVIDYLPLHGDVDIDELLDKYVNYYNINIDKCQWIRNILKTPLSVKLFCDLYKEKTFEVSENHQLIITSLINKKINQMDLTFTNEENETIEMKPISKILKKISLLFVENKRINSDVIISEFPDVLRSNASKILLYLKREGIIDIQTDNDGVDTYIYWGMQPTLDYLIAESIYERIENGEVIDNDYSDGIYQMLSILTVERSSKLISQFKCFKNEIDNLFYIDCFSLINSTPEKSSLFKGVVIATMHKSRDCFREITNRVIIPASKDDCHPLGAILLDSFLDSFEYIADRDTWWSIPAYLRYNNDCEWKTYREFDFKEIKINKNDSYLGRPLIIAWTLSNVNIEIRQNSIKELLIWAIDNENQYIELIKKFKDEKDQQILEELFSIAYGLSLRYDVSNDYLKKVTDFILVNIFSPLGLQKYQNTVIRYYCKGIVEIAISKGLVEFNKLKQVTPPYNYNVVTLPLYDDSCILSRDRMGGYGPIDYDLARYVLCDKLDRFFEKNRKTNEYTEEATKFIELYSDYYSNRKFSLDGFIISMAYEYLLSVGWNYKNFFEINKVDSLILGTYYAATHGSRSSIMSIAEKYTWISKHNMEAIFANKMPYYNFESTDFIDDYGELDNYSNPYQALIDEKQVIKEEEWIHIDELAKPLEKIFSRDSIEKWMVDEKQPDFQKWIFENNTSTILYTYTNRINEKYGIEETIWISSGLCFKDDFNEFISCLDINSHNKRELINVSNFHSYIDTCCYCSPQEACLIDSKKEIENELEFELNDRTIKVIKLVVDCLCDNYKDVEFNYTLPGKLLRKLLKIVYGDGYQYYNNQGEIDCKFNSVGENWETQQKCLTVNTKKFNKCIDDSKYKAFWLYRVYKSPNRKAYEMFNGIMHSTDHSYIVWKDNDDMVKYKELKEENTSETIDSKVTILKT